MTGHTSTMPSLWREIRDARERDLQIVQVRVTTDAIPGSPVTTMIAPERLRIMAARMDEDGLVADPEEQERWREVVIHPKDWLAVLVDPDMYLAVQIGTVTRVYGIVVRGS